VRRDNNKEQKNLNKDVLTEKATISPVVRIANKTIDVHVVDLE
jgi:hypothetical protein